MNNHKYKIGQKVRSNENGQDFFIVGIKTSESMWLDGRECRLVLHENKNTPSRMGFVGWPCQFTVIDNE